MRASPQCALDSGTVKSFPLSKVPATNLSPQLFELDLPPPTEDLNKPKSVLLKGKLWKFLTKDRSHMKPGPLYTIRIQAFLQEVFSQPLQKSAHTDLCRLYPRPQVETLMVPQIDEFLECLGNIDHLKRPLPLEADLQNHLRNFIDVAGPLSLMLHHLEKGPMAHDLIKHITCQSLRLLGHAVASLNKVRRKAILKKVGLQFHSVAAKGPTKGSGLFSDGGSERSSKRKNTRCKGLARCF